jgi:hypothetical protein
VDENKLAELFKDAARDAPPPSFDVGRVRAASHRATMRHRSAVALGSTMAVVLVFGGVALGTGMLGGVTSNTDSAAAGSAPMQEQQQAATPFDSSQDKSDRGVQPPMNIPEGPSTQGVGPSGSVSPSADGTPSGCGTVDRELANALAGELSVAPDQAVPLGTACPVGSRAALFEVQDGSVRGKFYVVVVPGIAKGADLAAATAGSRESVKPAKSGASVHVVSEPEQAGAAAPFADRVDAVASTLVDKF